MESCVERITEEYEDDLCTWSTERLYRFKETLDRQQDQVKGRRGPGPSYTRTYCRTMRKRVNAILRKRGFPATRPGDGRVYGSGQAAWQRAGG